MESSGIRVTRLDLHSNSGQAWAKMRVRQIRERNVTVTVFALLSLVDFVFSSETLSHPTRVFLSLSSSTVSAQFQNDWSRHLHIMKLLYM